MTTRLHAACPHCEALFLVAETQLNLREGLVRCGACGEIFNAKWYLTAPPDSGNAPLDQLAPPTAGVAPIDEADADVGADADVDASDADADGGGATLSSWLPGRLLWSAVALGLMVVLGWQATCSTAAGDQRDPSWLVGHCQWFAHERPPRKDLLTLTHTRIALHPRQPGALRVIVKLVNEATFAQPYPDLQITLTDRNGRVVGRRTFRPGDYLRAGLVNLLGSGELGVVQFDLASPHEKAVGFEIDIVAGAASS